MDLQLSGHASRPATVVCPLTHGEGFEGTCFPSPMILKSRVFLPRVCSPSCLLPSGVEAEKFPVAGFHQSCPYRHTRMGAVREPSSCRAYLLVRFREFERFCHAARHTEGREVLCICLQLQLQLQFVFHPTQHGRKSGSLTERNPLLPRLLVCLEGGDTVD